MTMTFIRINRNDTAVEVIFDTGTGDSGVAAPCIKMSWVTSSDIFAALLTDRLQDHLRAMLKKAREEAYNDGWRHAKSKKCPKRTEHYGHQP